MDDIALTIKLDAYLLGQMSPAEKAIFEAEISRDAKLARELEIHRLILPVPQRLAELDRQQKFAKWRAEMEDTEQHTILEPSRFSIAQKWLSMAAALLFLVIVVWFWQYGKKKQVEIVELKKQVDEIRLEKEKSLAEVKTYQEELERLRQIQIAAASDNNNQPPTSTSKKPLTKWQKTAEENLGDLYTLVDVPKGNGLGDGDATTQLFDAAKTEFDKKAKANISLIKANLLKIPPEHRRYNAAQQILAALYFIERDFGRAVQSYERYAATDDMTITRWRLLNFRLAAYPYQKEDFWSLLKKFEDGEGPFQQKAAALRATLITYGIMEQ